MQMEVGCAAEAYRILRHSCRQERKRAPTGANDWSSRSHSIITVALYMPELDLPGSAPADGQAAAAPGECGTVTDGHSQRSTLSMQRARPHTSQLASVAVPWSLHICHSHQQVRLSQWCPADPFLSHV